MVAGYGGGSEVGLSEGGRKVAPTGASGRRWLEAMMAATGDEQRALAEALAWRAPPRWLGRLGDAGWWRDMAE